MPTECSAELFEFAPVASRPVIAGFDGGAITSDAGALLLGATDRAIGLVGRFAECFIDRRHPRLVEHLVPTLVGQRVFGIALGYEDINDHDELRHDPVMAVLAGKLAARRGDCAPVAGKSTLNRLELSRDVATRYHKIAHDPSAIEALFVTLFLEAHKTAPQEIVLDLDATDDPLHGHQEGRFFHGYYDCYCYLPLYIFCGRHLLAAKLRPANIDAAAGSVEEIARIVAQIRARWPHTRIILRADSGFARDTLMSWCEANGVDFIFGLARNVRLARTIEAELAEARDESQASGEPARRFKELIWSTRKSWSRKRRVIVKAEWTKGEANPRFIVTSLTGADGEGRHLYEAVYCARGEMENRIKECQMDLFADRTSTATMKANQLRLYCASMAYVLIEGLRRIALQATDLADASCGTIRRKLFKIGALVTISVRRIKFAMASGCPYKAVFATAHQALIAAANTS
ncbi:IS1380 family transposase [Bradyrhizobium sp. Ash2021]|uniref:IS1380 family transposase n=1 Tax=Bradyrhizobium sp. Ash2021 TaxID=2954771 RepID=UPI0028168D69|nr:IS1380 family transposase [Bradyrhizobium sp. Ash2021]WMT79161.1 IS1380 family transposase [Bradyrhizobium sp. Ash2021]